mgnify:CR=1 FL=1
MKPFAPAHVVSSKETNAMMITMLAAAMTLAMLIATAFSLHQEAQRNKARQRERVRNPYMFR